MKIFLQLHAHCGYATRCAYLVAFPHITEELDLHNMNPPN